MRQGPWEVLPHGRPFVYVDRVTQCEPGRSASGTKLVSAGEVRTGVFPALLLLEAMAQLGGIAWLGAEPGAGAFLAAVAEARFTGTVKAGDALEVRAEVVRAMGALARMGGVAAVAGEEVARAEFTLAREPRAAPVPTAP